MKVCELCNSEMQIRSDNHNYDYRSVFWLCLSCFHREYDIEQQIKEKYYGKNRNDREFFLYVYRSSYGKKYEGGVPITFKEYRAIAKGLMDDPDVVEIRLCDLDDYITFHYKEGVILYPRHIKWAIEDYPMKEMHWEMYEAQLKDLGFTVQQMQDVFCEERFICINPNCKKIYKPKYKTKAEAFATDDLEAREQWQTHLCSSKCFKEYLGETVESG